MKSYELTILNQKFGFKSDNDEKQVKKVADYVNKKMHDIMTNGKIVATSQIAILTALNIADEFFKFKEDTKKHVTDWKQALEETKKKIIK